MRPDGRYATSSSIVGLTPAEGMSAVGPRGSPAGRRKATSPGAFGASIAVRFAGQGRERRAAYANVGTSGTVVHGPL